MCPASHAFADARRIVTMGLRVAVISFWCRSLFLRRLIRFANSQESGFGDGSSKITEANKVIIKDVKTAARAECRRPCSSICVPYSPKKTAHRRLNTPQIFTSRTKFLPIFHRFSTSKKSLR